MERQRRVCLIVAGVGLLALFAAACGDDDEPAVATSTPSGETPASTLAVATAAPTATEESTYTVQAGDTLYDLALEWGTTVEAIAELNELADANVLKVGQVLKKPPRSEQ